MTNVFFADSGTTSLSTGTVDVYGMELGASTLTPDTYVKVNKKRRLESVVGPIGGGADAVTKTETQDQAVVSRILVNNATPSTQPTDGALVVDGGVGIGGDTWIAGSIITNQGINADGVTANAIDTVSIDTFVVAPLVLGSLNATKIELRKDTDVTGNLVASGKVQSLNFGDDANDNLFVGNIIDPPTITGTENICVGVGAGDSITGGSANVLIGVNTGTAITGTVAGNNSAGSLNICIGSSAGSKLKGNTDTEARANVFIGVNSGGQAATSDTTGIWNTAIGSNTLKKVTTGNYNSSLGVFSLEKISTGSYNTAVGHYAGNNTVTGDYNVAIGYNAGSNWSGADSNQFDLSSNGNTLMTGDFSTGALSVVGDTTVNKRLLVPSSTTTDGVFIGPSSAPIDTGFSPPTNDVFVPLVVTQDDTGAPAIVIRSTRQNLTTTPTTLRGITFLERNAQSAYYVQSGANIDCLLEDAANSITSTLRFSTSNRAVGGYSGIMTLDKDGNIENNGSIRTDGNIDKASAAVLAIGDVNATKVELGKTGVTTEAKGDANVIGQFTCGSLPLGSSNPVFGFTGGGTFIYSKNTSRHTVCGNLVTYSVHLVWTSKGSGNGTISLNVPFQVADETACCTIGYATGFTFNGQLVARAETGGTLMEFFDLDNTGGAPVAINDTHLGTTGTLQVSVTYRRV